ncbi:MAG: YaeQ family protein [Polyangiaceae bacterium]|jgi:uncharacterized protein YaeQ|nr:YaeQ family protein [Polyangiaceae bacterium]MBK8938246.1 YaeQ family protein [Polyangiaceae bacterium]
MAAGATMRHLHVDLSDVDRGVYEKLELRLAQHPSESLRFLWTRIFAYCLSYEEGIQLSKGGLSNAEEAPLAVWLGDGRLDTWIDIGAPSAERLHKASKAARRVVIYTSASLAQLRKEAARRAIHRVEDIVVWSIPGELLDALGERTDRTMKLELVRNEEQIYATLDGTVTEGRVVASPLLEA